MASAGPIARFESKLDAMRLEMRSEMNNLRWLMGLRFAALVAAAIARLLRGKGSVKRFRSLFPSPHRRMHGGMRLCITALSEQSMATASTAGHPIPAACCSVACYSKRS